MNDTIRLLAQISSSCFSRRRQPALLDGGSPTAATTVCRRVLGPVRLPPGGGDTTALLRSPVSCRWRRPRAFQSGGRVRRRPRVRARRATATRCRTCCSAHSVDCLAGYERYPAELFMRIAQLAPLQESVPPARYGGTERVVSV